MHDGAGVLCGVGGLDVRHRLAGAELSAEERDARLHAAVEIRHDRREHRRVRQTRDRAHLAQVLVLLREGVLPGRGVQGVGRVCLIFGDHLLAAPAVARERVARQQRVRRQDARLDERIGEHDEAAGVAAGHGDALGRSDRCLALGRQLRKAVHPARRGAVRGRGVEHDRVRVFDQICRRDGRRVRQTQKRDVRAVEHLALRLDIVPKLRRQGQQRDVRALCQPVVNAQPGRAGAAVNENGFLFSIHMSSLASEYKSIKTIKIYYYANKYAISS